MHLLDHILAVFFAIGFPVIATPAYIRRKPALLRDAPGVRSREYVETIAWLAAMGVSTVVVWWVYGRAFGDLGLSFRTTWPAFATLGGVLLATGLLYAQVRSVTRTPSALDQIREGLAPVREFLPTTPRELFLFRGVALSAGVGEELFYRGFLLWYLPHFMPLTVAVVLSSLLFGVGHLGHGVQATVRATLVGGLLAVLYLVSGSLVASMILHLAIDLYGGQLGYVSLGDRAEAGGSDA